MQKLWIKCNISFIPALELLNLFNLLGKNDILGRDLQLTFI